jgi:hypothetical protein
MNGLVGGIIFLQNYPRKIYRMWLFVTSSRISLEILQIPLNLSGYSKMLESLKNVNKKQVIEELFRNFSNFLW